MQGGLGWSLEFEGYDQGRWYNNQRMELSGIGKGQEVQSKRQETRDKDRDKMRTKYSRLE